MAARSVHETFSTSSRHTAVKGYSPTRLSLNRPIGEHPLLDSPNPVDNQHHSPSVIGVELRTNLIPFQVNGGPS
ncbi:hypothetical protein MML61_27310 (plasmid) [Mycobacterium marinum]|uniref:hypothetical protein n=1 Tax=Mycobacterium marinum TaxID=1781 RepID=UPI001157BB62|nr:hypothetical protein [Mycobacterium marinum]WCS21216.1 hypothetical protein MML61_27310 [Mycobacterium marinum]WOR07575.1 hypothetical protein QDR78_27140 [Mycobacterium marinum]